MRRGWLVTLAIGVGMWTALTPGRAHDHNQPPPHPHDPVLQAEHLAMLDLVPDRQVTHPAVRDGRWSDPATWRDGKVPVEDAHVLIPKGRSVTVDTRHRPGLRTIRVDGTLLFAPDRDTGLRVDTLVVTPTGRLVMGTAERPIAPDRRAEMVFTDGGTIDSRWDPQRLSRGLISHGSVSLHGAPVTPYVALAQPPRRGDERLVLREAPRGWKVGDHLVLTGTRIEPNEDEEREILALSGNEVRVRPLAHDHRVPADGLSVYLANVTRNVVLASENTKDSSRAGHVMFMHSPDVTLAYAAFENLGRTDKRRSIDDPRLDEHHRLTAGTGSNPRGRYAVHFHRTGIDAAGGRPIRVRGCTVVRSPGWGFVNHSSFVEFEDNVAFDVTGSAFVTEAGDEIGAFRRNLAVRSLGSGAGVEGVISRRDIQDFGHEGDGFWFQGGGVAVEHNIAAGQRSIGFIFFTDGLIQEGLGKTRFRAANLPDPALAAYLRAVTVKDRSPDQDTVSVGSVPIRSFKGNVAFASAVGFLTRFHLGSPKPRDPETYRSVLEDGLVWNTRYGVKITYSQNVTLRNLRLVGGPEVKPLTAVSGINEGMKDIRYENLRVEGWPCGIQVPESGDHLIQGGYYNNQVSILIPTPLQRDRSSVRICGDVRFGTLPAEALHGRPQYDIYLDARFRPLLGNYRDPNVLFAADRIRLDTPQYLGRQLYFLEQAPDYVPFRREVPAAAKMMVSATGNVPEELIGKTNRELWERYGLAIGGTVAPADAVTAPRIHGLIGRPATYPRQDLHVDYRSKPVPGYRLTCVARDKRVVARSEPVELRPGWNLISLGVEGVRRSFLVFAGDTPAAAKEK